jgi:FkbM family methyltransferase
MPMPAAEIAPTPPVLLLAFSRPDLLRLVLERVREARPARLYIAVDGPRPGRTDDEAATADCRAVAAEIDWPCEVHTRFLKENHGCKLAVSRAISWFFEQVEEGIILEEDCVPGAAFFPFCAAMLARYRDDERVGMISGNNFLPPALLGDAGHAFTRYAFVWGWATWRRAWQKYDRDLTGWPARRESGWLRALHGTETEARRWREVLDDCYLGRRYDTWDYPWMFSCWQAGMLCLYPKANLVSNVGFDERGTHTTKGGDSNEAVPAADALAPDPGPSEVKAEPAMDRLLAARYYKIRRRPGTLLLKNAAAAARLLGWSLVGAVAAGRGRLGVAAAVGRLRARREGRPGRARVAGQVWEFGDAARFAAEFDRIWRRRAYDFRPAGTAPLIIDCGAGWGVATLFWTRRWPGARVLALEPSPEMLPRLRRNLAAAGEAMSGRVELRAQALGPADGKAPFVSMPDGRGHLVLDPLRGQARHLVEVETVSPRTLLEGRDVDLLKLTLGGAEHGLFEDPAVLARVARVFVDCHQSGRIRGGLEDVLARLRAAGFKLHVQEHPLSSRPFVRRGEEEGTLQRAQVYAYRR